MRKTISSIIVTTISIGQFISPRSVSAMDQLNSTEVIDTCSDARFLNRKCLFSGGVDIMFVEDKDRFPLHMAVLQSDFGDMVKLISEGVDINIKTTDVNLYTPLHYAIGTGNLKMVKFLVKNGADINVKDGDGCTPLMHAARNGDLEIFNYLVSLKGIDVNVVDTRGANVLFWATVSEKFPQMARVLIEKFNMDINVRNNKGRTPIMEAAKYSEKNVEFLLDCGVKPDCVDNKGNNLFHMLMKLEFDPRQKVQKKLLRRLNLDFNAQNQNGETPLDIAYKRSRPDLGFYLESIGAKRNVVDEFGGCLNKRTPLFAAVADNDFERVKELIQHGENVNQEENFCVASITPIFYAVINNSVEMVDLLLKCGAKIDCRDDCDATLLMWAAYGDSLEVYDYLLSKGADPSLLDSNGRSMLFYAVRSRKGTRLLEKFINEGADFDIEDELGFTPLSYAAEGGMAEAFILLFNLKKQENLLFRDNVGYNLLHYVFYDGEIKTEFLVSEGLDINHVSNFGHTPLDLAYDYKSEKLIDCMKSLGAVRAREE